MSIRELGGSVPRVTELGADGGVAGKSILGGGDVGRIPVRRGDHLCRPRPSDATGVCTRVRSGHSRIEMGAVDDQSWAGFSWSGLDRCRRPRDSIRLRDRGRAQVAPPGRSHYRRQGTQQEGWAWRLPERVRRLYPAAGLMQPLARPDCRPRRLRQQAKRSPPARRQPGSPEGRGHRSRSLGLQNCLPSL